MALFEKIHTVRMLTGTSGYPFASWMIFRGIHTAGLRIKTQCENAAKLALALEKNPHVKVVNHPIIESHPQHALTEKLFTSPYRATGMFSFEMPDDRQKINAFMDKAAYCQLCADPGRVSGQPSLIRCYPPICMCRKRSAKKCILPAA